MIDRGLVIEPLKELYKDEVRTLGEELGLPHDLVWRHPFPGPGLGVRILCQAEGEGREMNNGQLTMDHGSVPSVVLPVRSVGVQGDGRTYRSALALFSADDPCGVTDAHRRLATTIPNANPAFNRVLLCTSHAKPVEFHASSAFVTRERADLLRAADAAVDTIMRDADLYQKIWQFPVVLLPIGIERGQSIVLRPVDSTEAMTATAADLPREVLRAMTDALLALPGIDAVFLDLTSKPPGTIEWE
jgi:GMP synthase (glutamine-hydrolysing)